ncbi:hybrid sensor histidine kinase/response regulator [Candidatus Desantisbacteria bacterium CG_4_10_14_0_8_um_filter_48_22]|uniref:histidine kinase n=1 Tax=Candidatus Desantisbacteria bacterium CG_4_10_14_0_8_um_filter_48_22 TaxID=1974543 RepID=A0A2M7SE18_9BACT|nr:MAG: hybrid sensor histidine kinase/response regulator [Candidatus Desantisbacteria bacterium CG02_land_8_20_14_3_00_49_13]PIZ17758.1 MAG: hybrid sensor histidine kinase/response regulator [Candidatus Desantisbacteria bacterium CG_4_10_14_0_8_um_filter_48_22]PJB27659.1 MAG: hybrid sensor histidine kinase/response regulator [Candidatus Desantisbacteria bacterium CG_4_9_14_3_um_filter_50_7]
MRKKPNILIIDDDKDFVYNMRDILQEEGYTADTADNGQAAVKLCGEKLFDLILVDIKLPDMTGLELIERLSLQAQGTEYIVITGYASIESAVEAVRKKDIVSYETKPVDMNSILSLIRQVMERRAVEEQLRESEGKFRSVFEGAVDGILAADAETMKIKFANPAICRFLGYEEKELVNMGVNDIHPKGSLKHVTEAFKKQVKGEIAIAEDMPCLRKNGKVIFADIGSRPIRMGGRLLNVGFFRDVTDRKKMNEEILKAQKLESLGILTGGIAHDFNNMLTVIITSVFSMKTEIKPEGDAFEALGRIEKAALRAKGLTQQLLTFSKAGVPIKESASIAALIKESADFALSGSNVKCKFRIPGNLWDAEVDKGQMQQVMNNLIINAEQSMPKGGVINLSAENVDAGTCREIALKEGKYVKLSVNDNGKGIPEENLSRIFDPFFTTKEKGSGMGLSAAYSIIKKHNGYIRVESKEGTGTTFYIYIPAMENRPVDPGSYAPKKNSAGKIRILLMDDEEQIRQATGCILRSLGYEAELAADGLEAVELYSRAKRSGNPFDAVIMDLTIPGGMGGRDAIKELIKIEAEVRAIASSGYSNDPIMSEYGKYGFKGVVAKPYTGEELSNAILKVMK